METLLVDSLNFTKTFGIARSETCIQHNSEVLDLPAPSTLVLESEESIVVFPFGYYIILCEFTETAITHLYFFDSRHDFEKTQLPLLLQKSISEKNLDSFSSYHYLLQSKELEVDSGVSLKVNTTTKPY
jgi:hypothetical protein